MFWKQPRSTSPVASDEAQSEFPIRLMHVIDLLDLAGMEYGVIKLVNQLSRLEFSISICCLRHQTEATQGLLNPGIDVVELHRTPGFSWRSILKLSTLLRQRKIQILHSHNWSTFLYSVVAAKIAGTPVLIHGEHGREEQGIRKRHLLLSRLLSRRIDRLVTVSADLAAELIERWEVKPEKVKEVPNGVAIERFGAGAGDDSLRRELGLTPENKVILNIGRLRPVKDPETLLRAVELVHRRIPAARLLFVGSDHGSGMQRKLQEAADRLGIADAVRFVGIRHDIPRFLDLCDVYVNSSIFEGMSNTILEAMASRKPVVATSVGGNLEIVQDGLTGYLFPVGDSQTLAAHLLKLLRDPALLQEMGVAARQEIERKYQMSAMVESYANIYHESLARHLLRKRLNRAESMKKGLAHTLRWTGANRLRTWAKSDHLTILTYHRVLPLHEADQYSFASMVTPRDHFEAQMAFIARHCSALELGEAIDLMRRRQLPGRSVVVSFDDGYQDNYVHALPILLKYKVPAAFFIVSGVVGDGGHLWWDDVAAHVASIVRQQIHRDEKGARHLPGWILSLLGGAASASDLRHTVRQIVIGLNNLTASQRRDALSLLQSIAGICAADADPVMLSWHEVRALHASGMTIGSHTFSHAFMDELANEDAAREIRRSMEVLEAELRIPTRFFAYPAGRFNSHSAHVLKQAGIEASLTMLPGTNHAATDLHHLRRFDAGYSCLHTGFDAAVFEMELHGWLYPLRRLPTPQPYT